jgi:cytochrome c oxidase cbb3-type subunit 3
MDKSESKMEVHHYDGIEEQDNPIPFWFNILFFGSILFGMAYYSYYELGDGASLRTTYERDMAAREVVRLQNQDKTPPSSEDELFALTKEPEKMAAAKAIFATKCFACHGAQGQGGIGPNLTDPYWIHGGKLTDVRKTIAAGVLDQGMPPWEALLSFAEINQLAAYVRTLKGTNPPGAKAPQGELVKD